MATPAATAISRMLVSPNPRSRKRLKAVERMRFLVSPALGVARAGLLGDLRVGSIARPRKTLFPMPVRIERTQPAIGVIDDGQISHSQRAFGVRRMSGGN